MLKEQSRLLQQVLFVADLAVIAIAWMIAWVIRFELMTPPEYAAFGRYAQFLPGVLAIWAGVFLLSGLYQPQRAQRLPLIAFTVARAVFLGLVVSVVAMFFYRAFSFSRLHMLLFGLVSSGLLIGLRLVIYGALRQARQRGRNMRRVLIVGAGRAGRRLANAFRSYPWMGFEVVGFLDDSPQPGEGLILGKTADLPAVMDRLAVEGRAVDFVYIALPSWASEKIERIMDNASKRLAHVALVPDLFHFDVILNHRVSEVDGLPVIHLVDEAPYDGRRALKRAVDIAFSLVVLAPAIPPLHHARPCGEALEPGPRVLPADADGAQRAHLRDAEVPLHARQRRGVYRRRVGIEGREPGDARRGLPPPDVPRRAPAVHQRSEGRHVGGGAAA
jgi:putative colanic acid biosysnthesis UDP-glucose lipid carrier transferase